MTKRWQKTFNVNGHKITVVIKTRTNVGNFIGYSAEVTDNLGNSLKIPMIANLNFKSAQETAYVRFVQKYC